MTKTPAKKEAPKDPAKRRQSAEERAEASFGNVRSIGTTQRNKKEGPGMMASYTSMKRADAIVKAGKDLRSGKITKAQYDDIMAAIKKQDTAEVMMGKARASASRKKPVTLPPTPDFAKVQKKRGGVVSSFNKGGMASRKGNFDMRRGGMFMK